MVHLAILIFKSKVKMLRTLSLKSKQKHLDGGPKMETLPHPRDFMGPKWQDRVWSGDIKSGVCKMKCSALRFYATLSAKRSHIYMVGSGCGCLSVKQSFHQLYS